VVTGQSWVICRTKVTEPREQSRSELNAARSRIASHANRSAFEAWLAGARSACS
jgi:hypothetical protein